MIPRIRAWNGNHRNWFGTSEWRLATLGKVEVIEVKLRSSSDGSLETGLDIQLTPKGVVALLETILDAPDDEGWRKLKAALARRCLTWQCEGDNDLVVKLVAILDVLQKDAAEIKAEYTAKQQAEKA